MDKNLLEERIERIFSEIAEIPENQRKDSAEFSSLRNKLAEKVWQWAEMTFGKSKIQNASVEIMKCVVQCISSFDSTYGKFICYLSASLKNEISRAKEKNAVFEASCIKIEEKARRLMKNVFQYLDENALNINSAETQLKISQIFGIEPKKIANLARLEIHSETVGESALKSDGEEFSIFETIAGKEENPCDRLSKNDELCSLLEKIDKEISALQLRTRPYVSSLVTFSLLRELETAGILEDSMIKMFNEFSFFQTDESLKILAEFRKNPNLTQEEVASWFGRDKSDASRTMRKFLEKLKKDL